MTEKIMSFTRNRKICLDHNMDQQKIANNAGGIGVARRVINVGIPIVGIL
jgi:hypothetical protein